ncbi:hypothetical protein [Streptomyces sp. ECR3.8]|uniref:hypothetical protein n=1 Tax=Streptomyces sp. ECR3.8 TaxID=3461009 RepID=UPI004042B2E8
MSENPFSPPVRDHFDAGVIALTQGRTDDATTHLTDVAMQGTHRDRLMLADFLIAARDTRQT